MTPTTVMTTVSSVNPVYVDFSIAEQDYLRFLAEKQCAEENLELILGDGTIYPTAGSGTLRQPRSRLTNGDHSSPRRVSEPRQRASSWTVCTHSRDYGIAKGCLLIPQRVGSELQGVYQVGVVGPDNKVTIKTVKLGPQFGDMWVVESGLQPQEKVVSSMDCNA